jgi:mono/diheme cytochrome c family protein
MGPQSPTRDGEQRRLSWAALVLTALLVWVSGCGTAGGSAPNPSEEVDAGRALFASNCARCHGAQGQGDIGPRLDGGAVLRTFPSCGDQMLWVELGSTKWKQLRGPTFGATANPVRGGMPGFGSLLNSDQIRQVVTFTRVQFGGDSPTRAASDCSS